MQGLHLGPRQSQPPPHAAQALLHARNLGRRIEETRLLQPFLKVVAQLLHLDMAGKFGPGEFHHLRRDIGFLTLPLIAHQQHTLCKVEAGEIRVHRHRHQRIGIDEVFILQPGAFGAKQDAHLLAFSDKGAGIVHRPFRGHDRLCQLAPARGGGENEIAIGHRGAHIGKGARMVQKPPRPRGHRDRLGAGPAITRINHAQPLQPEVEHCTGSAADILAHLRADQHKDRRHRVDGLRGRHVRIIGHEGLSRCGVSRLIGKSAAAFKQRRACRPGEHCNHAPFPEIAAPQVANRPKLR